MAGQVRVIPNKDKRVGLKPNVMNMTEIGKLVYDSPIVPGTSPVPTPISSPDSIISGTSTTWRTLGVKNPVMSQPINGEALKTPVLIAPIITSDVVKRAIPHISVERPSLGLMRIEGFGVSHSSLRSRVSSGSRAVASSPKSVLGRMIPARRRTQ